MEFTSRIVKKLEKVTERSETALMRSIELTMPPKNKYIHNLNLTFYLLIFCGFITL
jgi:hypothetical protein